MTELEQRRDRDGTLVDEKNERRDQQRTEAEPRMTIGERLERRRLDEQEAKIRQERADQMAALEKELRKPLVARDLDRRMLGTLFGGRWKN